MKMSEQMTLRTFFFKKGTQQKGVWRVTSIFLPNLQSDLHKVRNPILLSEISSIYEKIKGIAVSCIMECMDTLF